MRSWAWFGYGPTLASTTRNLAFKVVGPSLALQLPLREMKAIGAYKPEFFGILGALNDMSYMMTVAGIIASGKFKSADANIMTELTFGPPMMLSVTQSMDGKLPDNDPVDLPAMKQRHFAALMRLLC
jgi:hypothetical protein